MHTVYTAYEDGTECSETYAYKIQSPENQPKERIQITHCSENDTFQNIYLFMVAWSSIYSPRYVTSVCTPEYEIISRQAW
jgi:hypothetical protein